MNPTIDKAKRIKIASIVIALLGNVIFFLTVWLLNQYDHVRIDQFLFQLKSNSEGVHSEIALNAVLLVGGLGISVTLLEIMLYRILSGNVKGKLRECFLKHKKYINYCAGKFCAFCNRRSLLFSLAVFICGASFFLNKLDVIAYVDTVSTESDFIEDHYVDPYSVGLTFPEKKRNLIYIFLESMENTFSDSSAGDFITDDYISPLSDLANANISFSHTKGRGGALSFSGTTWTAAAMVAQTSGLPVKVTPQADVYGSDELFLPGIVSLGEILNNNGYKQLLLLGSNAEFHGRESYFTQHGNYEIVDTDFLKSSGRLDEDYDEWWGFEDEKLFSYAKEEILRLASGEEPFNFTMLTADTHFPDGYECRLCRQDYESQYANVLHCSASQVYELVEWLKEQPFYSNTTVIISGDHLTMDGNFLENIDENYVRTVYNCIINSPLEPINEKERLFGTFDMFPTTLAALGVSIEGDRLGLGTNLFSAKKTLTEEFGFDYLDNELQKKSLFYNKKILLIDE